MPELPEVETVKETLKKQVLNDTILEVEVNWDNIIEFPTVEEFKKQIKNQKINDIKRRGKWLMFYLDDYVLLSHLRMEGRYFIKHDEEVTKHEHVIFKLKSGRTLRYIDTRKFGKMHLIKKEEVMTREPLKSLGLEPWDKNLDINYLKEKYKNKRLPIKTVLLDQSILVGNGNIYADEVLFLSKINPHKKASELTDEELKGIIENTKTVLENAIKLGGTTIRTFESSEGVHGLFQNELHVHGMNICKTCNQNILVDKIGGRSTYYCPNCQK